jgi:hypothetical protein
MSHEIPYYRAFLKQAWVRGTVVVNNPFTTAADDKFLGVIQSYRQGVKVPRTAVLPNKRAETENVPESFRNLVYPLDWQGIVDYVGVPAVLKDSQTGGRRLARRVSSVDELISAYDESDTRTMLLQSVVESDLHLHCFVIGGHRTMIARYSVDGSGHREVPNGISSSLLLSIENMAQVATAVYGYDINLVEFVVQDDEAILINPTNPVPQMEVHLMSEQQFAWCVDEIASLAVEIAEGRREAGPVPEWLRSA